MAAPIIIIRHSSKRNSQASWNRISVDGAGKNALRAFNIVRSAEKGIWMSLVEVSTEDGPLALEVGENSRAFIGLYDLTQAELYKGGMDTEAVVSLLVKYSGSDTEMARFFVNKVADMVQGKEPPDGWGVWAGKYARKFSAEKCKKDMRSDAVIVFAGLAGFGLVTLANRGLGGESYLQLLLIICSFVALFGLHRALLLCMDLAQFRGGDWPQTSLKP